MATITVTEILTYPIKSTTGSSVASSVLGPTGLYLDRHWALFDDTGKLLTAREFPDLLRLTTQVQPEGLDIYDGGALVLRVPLSYDGAAQSVDIFGVKGTGVALDDDVNRWFSEYLSTPCRLIFMNEASTRLVSESSGGQVGDRVSYADDCPVMLLSQGTLDELNEKLEHSVPIRQFRPNLVVSGCAPGGEDTWKKIRIGVTEFDVTKQCKRCNFATLNPNTRQMHEHQEPLRTLSTYRRHPDGGVAFGMLMIPRRFGTISLGDPVEVLA